MLVVSLLLISCCLGIASTIIKISSSLLSQVEEAKYIFESRTIQRMELLVLNTLEWRLSPVTPLSYIDHASRMIGLENRSCWIFTMRCKKILLNTLRGKLCISGHSMGDCNVLLSHCHWHIHLMGFGLSFMVMYYYHIATGISI